MSTTADPDQPTQPQQEPPAQVTQPTQPLPPQFTHPQPTQPQYTQPQYSHTQPAQTVTPEQQAQAHQYAAFQAPPVQPPTGSSPALHMQPAGQARPAKSGRGGTLLAGLAIGALLGGVVGGGTAAIVASNIDHRPAVVQSQNGALTLNESDTATRISGVAAVATPSVVTIEVSGSGGAGTGSGVVYSDEGYIITNAHVVSLEGADAGDAKIRVRLSDGRIFDAQLIGVDPFADIAVVKVEAEGLTPIKVGDSDNVNVGDLSVAIGAPLNLSNSVTSGVISALNRGISVGSPLIPHDQQESPEQNPNDDGESGRGFPWDFRFDSPDGNQNQNTQSSYGQVTLPVLQTDASINPGNSGGALLNSNGALIGINVAIASNSSDASTAGSVGLGFAIPVNLATRVADELIAGQQPSHGLLGASVTNSSFDTDADANHAGGLISEVTPGGAAQKAGLRVGDVVTAVDGVPADSGTALSALIRRHAGGSDVTLTFTRGGVLQETTATLGELSW